MAEQNKISKKTVEKLVKYFWSGKKYQITKMNNGAYNSVFHIKIEGLITEFIIRISTNPTYIVSYQKEAWCIAKAKEYGIDGPEAYEVNNNIIGTPYIIQKFIDAPAGNKLKNQNEIWEQLGKYARKINAISTDSYGKVFDWSLNTLSKHKTWDEYIVQELELGETIEMFEKHKFLSKSQIRKLVNIWDEMKTWDFEPNLTHNDFLPKNALFNSDDRLIAVLDWEMSESGHAPLFDVAKSTYLLDQDLVDSFIKGYGIKRAKYKEIKPYLTAFMMIREKGYVRYILRDKKNEEIEAVRRRFEDLVTDLS